MMFRCAERNSMTSCQPAPALASNPLLCCRLRLVFLYYGVLWRLGGVAGTVRQLVRFEMIVKV